MLHVPRLELGDVGELLVLPLAGAAEQPLQLAARRGETASLDGGEVWQLETRESGPDGAPDARTERAAHVFERPLDLDQLAREVDRGSTIRQAGDGGPLLHLFHVVTDQ